jgi:hypothetical protein
MNSKILVLALSALGIVMAFFMGRAAGQGQLMHIALVFGVMVGAPILLSLGKNYWYLIPASLISGLPAIPFGGRNIKLAEVCIALCFVIFITRVAFKLDKIVIWRATHIPIYLFMAWVAFIFCLYPVGLAVFGAPTMGGRMYANLALAFMAFIILASREITEKDCKWLFFFIIGGAIVNATYNVFSFFFIGAQDDFLSDGGGLDGFYTWHQNLASPAIAITFLLFAWQKPSVILKFKKPLLTFVYLIAIVLALYSGKRMGLVAVLIAPVAGAIIHKQYAYIWLGVFLAVVISASVYFGHGEYFRLPIQAQRTLSIIPADWDSEIKSIEGGFDPWRESLRRFAMENIERDPIIGRGFAVEYSEIIGQIMASKYVGSGVDSQAAPYAIGRSWHNTWLGYSADFGIPLSIIQAIIYLTVLIVSYRAIRAIRPGSPQFVISGYIFIFVVRDFLASHTSGHTSLDAFDRWWMYGVLFAIYAVATTTKTKTSLKTKSARDVFMERIATTKPDPVFVRN